MSFFSRKRDNNDFDRREFDNNFDRDYEVNADVNNLNNYPHSGQPNYNNGARGNNRDLYGRQGNYANQDYQANYRNDNYRQTPYNPNFETPSSRESYTRNMGNVGGYNNTYTNNYTAQNIPQQPINNAYQPQSNVSPISEAGTGLVVCKPKNFQDVKSLIVSLRNSQSIIVDIGNIAENDAYRIMDYLSGAIFALKGSIQKIAKNMYALVPHGATIQIPHDLQNRLKEEK